MKKIILFVLFVVSTSVWAHDEGHGPRLTDAPRYGGVVAPVIQAENARLGRKAPLVYKGELLRSEDGTVRVYLYTTQMKPLALPKFEKKGKAVFETKGNTGWEKQEFQLALTGNAFVGKLPKGNIRKPYNIDVLVTESGKTYLVAFDNLD